MLLRLGIFALLPVFAAASFAGAFLFFYPGRYDPPPAADVPFHQIPAPVGVPANPSGPGPSSDEPAAPPRQGLLLIDGLHNNAFLKSEIISLISKTADRGYDVEFVGDLGGAFTGAEAELTAVAELTAPPDPQTRLLLLEQKLRRADSFAVILPQDPYSEAESALVRRFVNKGGKLLLVSDPSRPQRINTLAQRFGLDFQPDYLYNTVENDLNFRHILIRDFQPGRLTAGVETVTLYMAGSIRSPGPGLAFADANTRSSLLEGAAELWPMAWGNSRNVLAIADLTFMVPPQDALLDNGKLLSNIADYLTNSERVFDLSDFPHFYQNGADGGVDILLGRPSLLNTGLQLKNGLSSYRLDSRISAAENLSRDTVFLGLYDDAPQVSQYLQAAGVRVDDTLGTLFAPELDLTGTAIIVLDRSQSRYALTVLADTPETLSNAVISLFSGEFRGNLVSDFVGVRK